jgi:hypothetical protein
MSKVKGLDGSSLPPCKPVLFQQILRANTICSVWNFATDPKHHIFPPDKNSWRKEKNKSGVESYHLHWFDGEMVPQNLDDVLDTDTQEEDKGGEEEEKEEEEEEEEEKGHEEENDDSESADSDED